MSTIPLLEKLAVQSLVEYKGELIFSKEKFAELIIEECASLFPMTFTDEQYQRRIDKTIRKHFGVQE
jgi:hypothetical protein